MSSNKVHNVFRAPTDPDIRIWRYMDFASFVAMLSHGGLFFSPIDRLDDPFEASIPKRWLDLDLQNALQAQRVSSKVDLITAVRETIKKQRSWAMVNCWHMNEEESAAMWSLYAKTNRAIAVQSTYQHLRDCLDQNVYIGTVVYISYDKDNIPFGNLFWPFVHKRKSFEHERELRALVCDVTSAASDEEAPKSGEWRVADLSKLVDAVYVAPSAPGWFVETVEDVSKRYGLQKPVKHSSLDSAPLH